MSAPALMVAISSSFVGLLIDKVGRRNVLIVQLVDVRPHRHCTPPSCRTSTFWSHRDFLLGVFEAAIMTTSTTLIGDYYDGKERQKWLIMQTVFVAVSAFHSS